MSRFLNLELGGESEDHAYGEQTSLVKDEAYYLGEARAAFESARFEVALRHYSKVLEYNPKNTAAWTGQVRMLIELGEFREAKLWADKALETFPREPELLAAKAVALGRSGDLQGALAFSDAAIEERGDTPYIWLARGDVLLAPRDWFVAWLAARIRAFHEQFALAFKLMQSAVEWNAGHFVLWLELGHCQHALGLIGPARNSYAQARQLNPRCAEVEVALGKLSETGIWSRLRGWGRQLLNS